MNVQTDRQRPHEATRSGPPRASTTARIGWVVLLAISIVGVLNHLLGVLAFATSSDERLAFAMFAFVNAYATAVLLVPYRRRVGWAWSITWLEVAAFASVLPLTGGGSIGVGYLVVAAVAALAQLATLPDFRSGPLRAPRGEPLQAST